MQDDKLASLELKLSLCETERDALQSENKSLKQEMEEMREKMVELKVLNQQLTNESNGAYYRLEKSEKKAEMYYQSRIDYWCDLTQIAQIALITPLTTIYVHIHTCS